MLLNKLYLPTVIYIIFLLIHIVSDLKSSNKLVNNKIISGLLFAFIIQLLCYRGLNILAWLLVFVPIILHTYTTTLIYMVLNNEEQKKMSKKYMI